MSFSRRMLVGLLLMASFPMDGPVARLRGSLAPAVTWLLLWLSRAGDPGTLAGLVALLMVGGIAAGRSRPKRAAVVLGAALVGTALLVWALKWLVNRGADGVLYGFWQRERGTMFPSGHTAMAFAACAVIGRAWPRARWPALLVAAGVAASRACLSHFLSDVVAGALLGSLMGQLTADCAAKTTLLSLDADPTLAAATPTPGPGTPGPRG